MDTSFIFAQLWAPIFVAIGLGLIVSRSYYIRVYRDIADEPLAALTLGMFLMILGLIQVLLLNSWVSITASIMTLIGWGTLLKGALFLIAPTQVSSMARAWGKTQYLPLVAIGVLVLGIYLGWYGYLS